MPAAPVPDTHLSGLALLLGVFNDQAPALVDLHFVVGITDKLAQFNTTVLLDC